MHKNKTQVLTQDGRSAVYQELSYMYIVLMQIVYSRSTPLSRSKTEPFGGHYPPRRVNWAYILTLSGLGNIFTKIPVGGSTEACQPVRSLEEI